MKDFLISPLRLKRLGILGMNKRNRDYIARYNERSLFPLVDENNNKHPNKSVLFSSLLSHLEY